MIRPNASAIRPSPLERASDRLRIAAATPKACFDDLGAPGYDEYLAVRRSFLDRLAAQARTDRREAVSGEGADRG